MDSKHDKLPVWMRGPCLDSPIERRALLLACVTCVKEPDATRATFMRLLLKAPDLNAAEELWYAALGSLHVSSLAAEMITAVARRAGVVCDARRIRVEWIGGSFDVQEFMHKDVWPMRFVAKLLLELFSAPNHDAALEILANAFVLAEDNHG